MKLNKAILSTVACSLFALATVGQANAADLGGSLKDGPIMMPFTWSGPYVGVQGGYAWDKGSNVPWGDIGGPMTENDGPLVYDSFVGGAHIGYNFQRGRIVWGVEGDIEFAPGKGDDEDRGGHTNGIDTNFQASIRGRLGLAFDRTLFYLTGGYSYLDADAVVRDISYQPSISTSFGGWTLGGGVEHALTNSISLRLEYRYTDYGLTVENYNQAGYSLGFEPEIHAVRAGISTKF